MQVIPKQMQRSSYFKSFWPDFFHFRVGRDFSPHLNLDLDLVLDLVVDLLEAGISERTILRGKMVLDYVQVEVQIQVL